MPRAFPVAALFLLATSSFAADWPQWRGPNRDGVSAETGLLKEWPSSGPKLVWDAPGAGRGYSSLAVAKGKVYTVGDTLSTSADDPDEFLVCLDEATGKTAWKAKLGRPYSHRNKSWESSRSTPTVDGDLIFVLTGNGELVCVETNGGKEKWRKSLTGDFGGKKGDGWGYSESPLVDGDRVIVTPGGKTTMVALDKKTGKTEWQTILPKNPGAGHASAVLTQIGNTKVIVQTTAGFGLGVRANDGKVLWNIGSFTATAVIPTPIVRGDLVLLAAGYGKGGTLVRQVPDGDGVKAEEVYPKTTVLANKHGGIVLVGDYLYGDTEDSGTPFCAELMTGKSMWKKRVASGSMSLVAADGHLYMHFASGTMALVKATPDECKVVSTFKLPHRADRPDWAHPVVANGKLYVRQGDNVVCYDVRAK